MISFMQVQTLYKTPTPGTSVKSGEYYSLSFGDRDGRGRYEFKETHGNWNEVEGKTGKDTCTVTRKKPMRPWPKQRLPLRNEDSFEQNKAFSMASHQTSHQSHLKCGLANEFIDAEANK